jgi:hypothetical protein
MGLKEGVDVAEFDACPQERRDEIAHHVESRYLHWAAFGAREKRVVVLH